MPELPSNKAETIQQIPTTETTHNPDFQQTSSLLLPVTAKNLP